MREDPNDDQIHISLSFACSAPPSSMTRYCAAANFILYPFVVMTLVLTADTARSASLCTLRYICPGGSYRRVYFVHGVRCAAYVLKCKCSSWRRHDRDGHTVFIIFSYLPLHVRVKCKRNIGSYFVSECTLR